MSTISARVGRPRERRSEAAIRIPGVQKPHWSAWWRRNDSCSAVSGPGPASDSTVSTLLAVRLHGEEAAAADGDPVQEDRARAADAVLAADVRPGEPQAVAEEVGQQEPRLDSLAHRAAVHGELDLDHDARSIARVVRAPVSSRR